MKRLADTAPEEDIVKWNKSSYFACVCLRKIDNNFLQLGLRTMWQLEWEQRRRYVPIWFQRQGRLPGNRTQLHSRHNPTGNRRYRLRNVCFISYPKSLMIKKQADMLLMKMLLHQICTLVWNDKLVLAHLPFIFELMFVHYIWLLLITRYRLYLFWWKFAVCNIAVFTIVFCHTFRTIEFYCYVCL